MNNGIENQSHNSATPIFLKELIISSTECQQVEQMLYKKGRKDLPTTVEIRVNTRISKELKKQPNCTRPKLLVHEWHSDINRQFSNPNGK